MPAVDILKSKRTQNNGEVVEPSDIQETEVRTLALTDDELKSVEGQPNPVFKVQGSLDGNNLQIESVEPMNDEVNASGDHVQNEHNYVRTHTQLMPS